MSPEEYEHRHPEVPAGMHPEHPEQRDAPAFRSWWVGGWLSPFLVAGGTLVWVFLIYWLIGDRPTNWKYGVIPYVPGESLLSTERPRPAPAPQVTFPVRETGEADVQP